VIITHINPDGDAIGSSLGLNKLLLNLGHKPYVITPNNYPGFLKWMPGNDTVIVFNNQKKKGKELIEKADMIFCVDFNDLRRIKQLNTIIENSPSIKILIDHHPNPTDFADIQYTNVHVSSTAELIYGLIHELGLKKAIDIEAATCLFTGIMTDTGCFSYNSSNPRTFEITAELLKYGFDKDEIYKNIYDNFSSQRMRLFGFALNEKMEVFPEYHTAIISLTSKEQKRYGFQLGDSEGFVNYPLSIRGMRFSALLMERENHIKLSLRSKGNFAVNKFSENHFNGGGHFNAAGGESFLSMDDTIKKFRNLLPKYKNELTNHVK